MKHKAGTLVKTKTKEELLKEGFTEQGWGLGLPGQEGTFIPSMLTGVEYQIVDTIGEEDSVIKPTKDTYAGFMGYQYDGMAKGISGPISDIHIKEVIKEGLYDSFKSMLFKMLSARAGQEIK